MTYNSINQILKSDRVFCSVIYINVNHNYLKVQILKCQVSFSFLSYFCGYSIFPNSVKSIKKNYHY